MNVRGEGRIAGRAVFRGNLLAVHVDRVRLPDGSEAEREVVRHPGAAAVLPLRRPGREAEGGTDASVVLLRQYRYAVGEVLWEIPAGTLEPGESAAECAARELREEAGLEARKWQELGRVLTTPGVSDERAHLFLATGLEETEAAPEPGEQMERREVGVRRALAMVREGEIVDAKTVCALLLASASWEEARG